MSEGKTETPCGTEKKTLTMKEDGGRGRNSEGENREDHGQVEKKGEGRSRKEMEMKSNVLRSPKRIR